MLTTKEYAEYTGIKLRTVKDRLKKGTIPSVLVIGKSNKEEYRISITELSTAQQLKYFKDCGEKIALPLPQKEEKKKKSLETLSEAERKKMVFWVDLIEKWQSYRNQSSDTKKAVIDERFIASVKLDYPDLELSSRTLYRKWFQSTHPVWGATMKKLYESGLTEFQSTHPVWGATFWNFKGRYRVVSFNPHTPCGVRPFLRASKRITLCFNPHTPCGVRLLAGVEGAVGGRFQSTHPVWGATYSLDDEIEVEESFNPHTPCGVRLNCKKKGVREWRFQSTQPVWGATSNVSIGGERPMFIIFFGIFS